MNVDRFPIIGMVRRYISINKTSTKGFTLKISLTNFLFSKLKLLLLKKEFKKKKKEKRKKVDENRGLLTRMNCERLFAI